MVANETFQDRLAALPAFDRCDDMLSVSDGSGCADRRHNAHNHAPAGGGSAVNGRWRPVNSPKLGATVDSGAELLGRATPLVTPTSQIAGIATTGHSASWWSVVGDQGLVVTNGFSVLAKRACTYDTRMELATCQE
jgi:hypothetical protein